MYWHVGLQFKWMHLTILTLSTYRLTQNSKLPHKNLYIEVYFMLHKRMYRFFVYLIIRYIKKKTCITFRYQLDISSVVGFFFFLCFFFFCLFFQMRALSMPVNQADLEALAFQQDLALHGHHSFQSGFKHPQDKSFRNRLGLFFVCLFFYFLKYRNNF